jgi:hypothetical protein
MQAYDKGKFSRALGLKEIFIILGAWNAGTMRFGTSDFVRSYDGSPCFSGAAPVRMGA